MDAAFPLDLPEHLLCLRRLPGETMSGRRKTSRCNRIVKQTGYRLSASCTITQFLVEREQRIEQPLAVNWPD